jgi:uncharacterized protein YbjT (DUF2867 family)
MKAIILGATGLVGRFILEIALEREEITEVVVFSRRSTGLNHQKLQEVIVDFKQIDSWKDQIQGDILFSALGTTLKTAGSQAKQFEIDHDFQLFAAMAAAANGVKTYILISSLNANKESKFFYLRMKGELEDKIKNLSFSSTAILRPGPLFGKREKPRLNEVIFNKFLRILPSSFVSSSIHPVSAEKVARMSVKLALEQKEGIRIVTDFDS